MSEFFSELTMRLLISLFLLIVSITTFAGNYSRPNDATIKSKLTAMQYYVTQKNGTEPAFKNAYWNNTLPGIYVDVVTGEPLFSSRDKYDSKTGWPSFTKPLEPTNIEIKHDNGWFTPAVEVHSKIGRSHLGHILDDGPPPTGKRYCMNSAALEFIPVKDLQKRGYGQYLPLFNGEKQTSH